MEKIGKDSKTISYYVRELLKGLKSDLERYDEVITKYGCQFMLNEPVVNDWSVAVEKLIEETGVYIEKVVIEIEKEVEHKK